MSEPCKCCGRFIFGYVNPAHIADGQAFCEVCAYTPDFDKAKQREEEKRRKRNAKAKARRNAMKEVAESLGLTMVRGAVSGKIYFE